MHYIMATVIHNNIINSTLDDDICKVNFSSLDIFKFDKLKKVQSNEYYCII